MPRVTGRGTHDDTCVCSGCQRHPERPLAQTVHGGQPFRRYTGLGSQAAPSQYRLQGGVFGHPNEGFMDSVHTKGGGELERMERVAAEQENFRSKIKGDRKFMMALLKQPDRFVCRGVSFCSSVRVRFC